MYRSRQCKVKSRTFGGFTLGPGSASMPGDDTMHISQADAYPFKIV
jgi:hypothetical protein